jgi:hypothetical protein
MAAASTGRTSDEDKSVSASRTSRRMSLSRVCCRLAHGRMFRSGHVTTTIELPPAQNQEVKEGRGRPLNKWANTKTAKKLGRQRAFRIISIIQSERTLLYKHSTVYSSPPCIIVHFWGTGTSRTRCIAIGADVPELGK